jgi:hypothetical protein
MSRNRVKDDPEISIEDAVEIMLVSGFRGSFRSRRAGFGE